MNHALPSKSYIARLDYRKRDDALKKLKKILGNA